MENLLKSGRYLFALAIIGIGLIHFVTGNFPSTFLPVPEIPGRGFLVYLSGLIFCVCGISLFFNRVALSGSIVLGCTLGLLFLYPHLPKLLANLRDPGEWAVAAETLALCGGAFIMARLLMNTNHPVLKSDSLLVKTAKTGPYIFALSFIVFAVQHFMYADFIASLVPSWMPAHLFLTYLVMFVFILISVNIFLNIQMVNTAKIFGFTFLIMLLVLHIPRVINSVHKETEWTSMFIAMAMSGIGFVLSDIFLHKRKGL